MRHNNLNSLKAKDFWSPGALRLTIWSQARNPSTECFAHCISSQSTPATSRCSERSWSESSVHMRQVWRTFGVDAGGKGEETWHPQDALANWSTPRWKVKDSIEKGARRKPQRHSKPRVFNKSCQVAKKLKIHRDLATNILGKGGQMTWCRVGARTRHGLDASWCILMHSSIHLCVLPSGGLKHSHCIRFVWHEVCESAHLHMTGTFSRHAHILGKARSRSGASSASMCFSTFLRD